MSETRITLDGETFECVLGAWFDLAEDAPRSPLPSSSVFVHALNALAAARAEVEELKRHAVLREIDCANEMARANAAEEERDRMAEEVGQLTADLAAVRKALEGLVGETEADALRQMEQVLAAVPHHPEQGVTLAAVRTLLTLAAQEGANG